MATLLEDHQLLEILKQEMSLYPLPASANLAHPLSPLKLTECFPV